MFDAVPITSTAPRTPPDSSANNPTAWLTLTESFHTPGMFSSPREAGGTGPLTEDVTEACKWSSDVSRILQESWRLAHGHTHLGTGLAGKRQSWDLNLDLSSSKGVSSTLNSASPSSPSIQSLVCLFPSLWGPGVKDPCRQG